MAYCHTSKVISFSALIKVLIVPLYLGEAGLVIQYAEDAVRSGGDQLQTGLEVLELHGIPLDLFCTVLLLQDTHTHTHT